MSEIRMGEALGLRPPFYTAFFGAVTGTLPRFDPMQYGVADYSFYEGLVDFALAKANGVKRPVIRVGQGYYGIDSQFKNSSANSKGLFSRDFYWMLDSHQSANGQALACANALKQYGQLDSDSIVFADFELQGTNASFLWGFLSTLKANLPGVALGIYTGYSFFQTNGSIDPKYGFDQYKLWIAWPVSPYVPPKPLAPWGTNWYYHQWTFAGDGKFYGAQSLGVDLNYLNPALVPAPPPPPAPATKQYTVTGVPADRIRSDPSFPSDNGNVVGNVLTGSVVYGEPTSDGVFVKLEGYIATSVLQEVPPTPVPVPTPTPTPQPAPVGTFYQVLHDEDFPPEFLPRMLYPQTNLDPTKGTPETVNLEGSSAVPLDKHLQLFIYNLLLQSAPSTMTTAMVKKAYRVLLGAAEAFANGSGYPQGAYTAAKADYVNGTNLLAPLPKLDRSRITGGNVVLVLDETPTNIGGVPCLKVATLKASDSFDVNQINYVKTPWFVFLATVCTPNKLPSGRYAVIRFPQLDGNNVPFPLITKDGFGYIAAARLKKVDNPFAVDPYVFS